MSIIRNERAAESPLISLVWHAYSHQASRFISTASSQWEIVVTKYEGQTSLTLRGPETHATLADCPAEAEVFGMPFKLGTFMPHLPLKMIMNRQDLTLPSASQRSFWLHGAAWEIPTYDNADVFVAKLAREGLLIHDPIVEAALQGQVKEMSLRSVQRHFVRTTGLTHGTIYQIARAHHAMSLLQQGKSILDTVEEAGYADQPHLTKSLKHFVGQTPAQIIGQRK